MEQNLSGKSREAEEERRRRENLERQLSEFQQERQRQIQKPAIDELTDEQLAAELNRATIDGDNAKTASILKQVGQKARRESKDEMAAIIQQASAQSQQQQSYQNYLMESGLKAGTPLQQRTASIVQEIQDDIKTYGISSRYYYTGNNLAWITSIAMERAKSVTGADKAAAAESARLSTSQGAGTESGSRSNGAPPGKSAAATGTIYLTEAEKKTARNMYDNLSMAEAERRYWNGLPPGTKEGRTTNRRAM
jgi:hypothetical protein